VVLRQFGCVYPDAPSSWRSTSTTSVGLVQRLAEQLCRAEGLNDSGSFLSGRPTIGTVDSWNVAKRAVAQQMEGRFETFADNFVRGMHRLPEGLEVYKFLLRAATDATDEDDRRY